MSLSKGVPPGPRLPTNGSLGVMSAQSQPRLPAPNNQQKGPAKTQAMPRQLTQQQHTINNSVSYSLNHPASNQAYLLIAQSIFTTLFFIFRTKTVHTISSIVISQGLHLITSSQEAWWEFSKETSSQVLFISDQSQMISMQRTSGINQIFFGISLGQNSSQSSSSGPENDLQAMSCHLPGRSGSKMSPSPADRRFGIGADCHPSSCIGQFQQHNNQNRIGPSQNKARFLGPNAHGNSFGMNNVAGVQHPRPTADLHPSGVPGQGLGGLMKNVNMGWGSANKQVTAGLNVRRLPNPLQSQGAQLDMPNLPYQQRHIGPPNQVAPDIGMIPHNPSIRDTGPRPSQPMMGSPSAAVGNLNQASPEQRVPAGNFAEPSPSSNNYQNNRANRLTFDFLPEGDNTVPGINTDSDFIDSLLKSGSGNDDWMKDINLDEILGSHS